MRGSVIHQRNDNVIQMRMVFAFLIAVLAWDALDWGMNPSPLFVSASYVLLGFVCAAAFPSRPWVGILIGVTAAVVFEMLQSLVPGRSVRIIEMVVKWLCIFAGVACEFMIVFAWRRLGDSNRLE